MAINFDADFCNYTKQISQYQDQVNSYKKQLQAFKDKPRETLAQILPEVGIPAVYELAKKGLFSSVASNTGPIQNKVNQLLGESPEEPEQAINTDSAVQANAEGIEETSFPSDVSEYPEATDGVGVTDGEGTANPLEEDSLKTIQSFGMEEPEAMAGSSSNIIGRFLSSMTDSEAAQRLATSASERLDAVAQATKSTTQVAQQALNEGASAIADGKDIVTPTEKASSEAIAGAEDAGEALDTAAEASAATSEFDPFNLLVAGGLAIGGLLTDAFDPKPKPVAIPNVPIPTFQPGVGSTSQ